MASPACGHGLSLPSVAQVTGTAAFPLSLPHRDALTSVISSLWRGSLWEHTALEPLRGRIINVQPACLWKMISVYQQRRITKSTPSQTPLTWPSGGRCLLTPNYVPPIISAARAPNWFTSQFSSSETSSYGIFHSNWICFLRGRHETKSCLWVVSLQALQEAQTSPALEECHPACWIASIPMQWCM